VLTYDLLGHDKLDTTARYVNDEQKFGGEARCDYYFPSRTATTLFQRGLQADSLMAEQVHPTRLEPVLPYGCS
jgi:hypothetical protein